MRSLLVILLTSGALSAQEPMDPGQHVPAWVERATSAITVHGRVFADIQRANPNEGDLRQLRLRIVGDLSRTWRFRTQFELTDIDAPFLEFLLECEVAEDLFARAGQFREPFGLEANTGLGALPFLERSAPTDAFSPGRNRGAALRWMGDLNVSVGGFQGADEAFGPCSSDHSLAARAWTTWQPSLRERIHLGLSVSSRDAGTGALRFRARPGSKLLPHGIDTGDLPGAEATTYAAEAAWQSGPRTLQAEWLGAEIELAGGPRASLSGVVVSGAWFLTGETRSYSDRRGAWTNVVPKGAGPALELVARASFTDLTDGPLSGGEQTDVDVGVNIHLSRYSRVMIHLVHSDAQGLPDFDGLLLRFHAGF